MQRAYDVVRVRSALLHWPSDLAARARHEQLASLQLETIGSTSTAAPASPGRRASPPKSATKPRTRLEAMVVALKDALQQQPRERLAVLGVRMNALAISHHVHEVRAVQIDTL